MNYLEFLHRMLGVASASGLPYAQIGQIAVELILKLKAHTGMTTEQLMEQAGITIDENTKWLTEDLVRLEEEIIKIDPPIE